MGKRSKKEARAAAPKLGIAAMKIPGNVTNIPISDIKPSLISEVDIPDAVVAYLDILGFSNKSGDTDITTSLADFSGPLAIAATKHDQVYFNVFSDCAFAAAAVDHADEILAVLRFAFGQWASDGILVRGGIALGTYKETYNHALTLDLLQAQRTFTGKLFAGSGVTAAVRLEGQGAGALLFTSDDCGQLYAAKFREPISTLGEQKLLGWSDDENDLFGFSGYHYSGSFACWHPRMPVTMSQQSF